MRSRSASGAAAPPLRRGDQPRPRARAATWAALRYRRRSSSAASASTVEQAPSRAGSVEVLHASRADGPGQRGIGARARSGFVELCSSTPAAAGNAANELRDPHSPASTRRTARARRSEQPRAGRRTGRLVGSIASSAGLPSARSARGNANCDRRGHPRLVAPDMRRLARRFDHQDCSRSGSKPSKAGLATSS